MDGRLALPPTVASSDALLCDRNLGFQCLQSKIDAT